MSRKMAVFAADLAAGIALSEETAPRRQNIASNVLTGRATVSLSWRREPSSAARTSWSIPLGVGCGQGTIVIMRC